MSDWPPLDELIVLGEHRLDSIWWVFLPEKYALRLKGDVITFWQPGVIIQMNTEPLEPAELPDERITQISQAAPIDRFNEKESSEAGLQRYSYQFTQEQAERTIHGLFAAVLNQTEIVNVTAYLDDPDDASRVMEIIETIHDRPSLT